MLEDEVLHGDDHAPLQVLGLKRMTTNLRSLRAGPSKRTGTTQVMTLCLHPHHWYFAQGARVHNKGCFVPSSEVTLADGTRKQIKDIEIGEQVQSWDEVHERPAISTVKAVPAFERRRDELVEISLPNATILATEDHPIWSHGRGTLVSSHPGSTHEEYGLNASSMLAHEVLHGDNHAPLQVLGLKRMPTNFRSLRAGPSTRTGMTQVMTLCLHPHHWYFAQGARVHNKGCFVPSSEVTLADGTRKQIKDVEIGEQVQSWDEVHGRPAISTVKAVPAFERARSELVEISLPNATILATEDHPIWSHGRGTLVSSHPDSTHEEYGLNASSMLAHEVLHGDDHAPLQVLGLQRMTTNLRSLRAGPSQQAGMTQVMTLCLHPHHWYFVQGARVHNKGCFVPSSEVTLADGTQRQIKDIEVGQLVQSWDEKERRVTPARVKHVLHYDRDAADLVTISVQGAEIEVTSDHPFWSHGRHLLVSMYPEGTRSKYGLAALQMYAGEQLEDAWQMPVNVTSIRRSGLELQDADSCPTEDPGRPPQLATAAKVTVSTLSLENHHWFYVHGVRVHNKGGGRGGGSVGGTSRSVSRSSFSRPRLYVVGAVWLYSGSRRRYGSYAQDEGSCEYEADSVIEQKCYQHIAQGASDWQSTREFQMTTDCNFQTTARCCHNCMACEDEDCMDEIPGCESFLGDIHTKCTEHVGGIDVWAFVVLIIVGLCFCGCCVVFILQAFGNRSGDSRATGEILQEFQNKMDSFAGNHAGLPERLVLRGHYNETRGNVEEEEDREAGSCSYTVCLSEENSTWGFSQSGYKPGCLTGTGVDQWGGVSIEGKLNVQTGDIVWKEITGDGATSVMWGYCAMESGKLEINLSYKSDYLGTEGTMTLSAEIQAVESAERASLWSEGDARSPEVHNPIVLGTVVGAPVSGDQDESKEGKVSTFKQV
eukprot:TRINITY_DN5026_c0_g2_i1.p1 TRINITY_DN5026_c0_g2~~TRINITY_DN5026_c0_g2_i1.p1  ORF type:complete len:1095 (-),score=133.32 TRINITY_DN5026_c0_g2_i1:56-2860(-)